MLKERKRNRYDTGAMEIEMEQISGNNRCTASDRFIPSYIQKSYFETFESKSDLEGKKRDLKITKFNSLLKSQFFNQTENTPNTFFNQFSSKENFFSKSKSGNNQRLLFFQKKTQSSQLSSYLTSTTHSALENQTISYQRNIKKTPYKILDSPQIQDDFYFDLVDWSSSNYIQIGLINHVYCLNNQNSKSFKLKSFENDVLIQQIKQNSLGDLLAVGTTYGDIQIFDLEKKCPIRDLEGHSGRVGALSWKENLIASGSQDGFILISDIRQRQNYEIKLLNSRQEICGLSFNSFDFNLAQGSNDNRVNVWEIGRNCNFNSNQNSLK